MPTLLFALLLTPAAAWPAALCESAAELQKRVSYCDENLLYVAPAKSCRDLFRQRVREKSAEVKRLMDTRFKTRKGSGQADELAAESSALSDAGNALSALISDGGRLLQELDTYIEDMVLPIYEAYEEDFDLDPKSREGQKIFREKECYGEPVEEIERLQKELRKMVRELETTKSELARLLGLADSRENLLDAGDNGGPKAATGNRGEGSGAKKNAARSGRSTITGVEQDRGKREGHSAPR